MMQAVGKWYFLWMEVGVQEIFRVFGDLPFSPLYIVKWHLWNEKNGCYRKVAVVERLLAVEVSLQ